MMEAAKISARVHVLSAGLALLVLAGCGGSSEPTAIPPGVRGISATLPARTYRESAGVLTAENVAQASLLGRLDQPEDSSTLFSHTVSPDGTRLIALNNEEVLAWDLLTGDLAFRTARLNAVRAFYSPDKTEVFTVAPDGRVIAYNADTGAENYAFNAHPAYNNGFAYDALAGIAAFGGTNGIVRVWDLLERRALAEIEAHTDNITALALSNRGDLLLTAGADNYARLWRWADRVQTGQLALDDLLVYRAAFSPDDAQVALGSEADIRLWSAADASQTRRLTVPTGGAVDILAYSPAGSYLIGGNPVNGAQIWNPVTSSPVAALPDLTGNQVSVDFSPDGDLLLASVIGGDVAVYNIPAATDSSMPRGAFNTGNAQIFAVEWTSDSRLILMFDASGPVYVWGVG
jgi:WD40 repeat protein